MTNYDMKQCGAGLDFYSYKDDLLCTRRRGHKGKHAIVFEDKEYDKWVARRRKAGKE